MAVDSFVLANESMIRLAAFFGILAVVAAVELMVPQRALSQPRSGRWFANLAIVAINSAVLRLAFPLLAVGMAAQAAERGWGLFNVIAVPAWVAILGAVVVLDLVIYVQHRLFHRIPLLWRLHRMHHADLDIDVTTGARFHPIEIVLSMAIKLGAVIALGAPPVAVILFEVVLNAAAMFNHGNIRLPGGVDRWLRLILVTPDMHRVHHSRIAGEYNSNFGFNLPWWDRLFATYRAAPALGHRGMAIGLPDYDDPRRLTLLWLLAMPFLGPKPRSRDNAPGQ